MKKSHKRIVTLIKQTLVEIGVLHQIHKNIILLDNGLEIQINNRYFCFNLRRYDITFKIYTNADKIFYYTIGIMPNENDKNLEDMCIAFIYELYALGFMNENFIFQQ